MAVCTLKLFAILHNGKEEERTPSQLVAVMYPMIVCQPPKSLQKKWDTEWILRWVSQRESFIKSHVSCVRNTVALCNICKVKLSTKGGSTLNLLRHLRLNYPSVKQQAVIQDPAPLTQGFDSSIEWFASVRSLEWFESFTNDTTLLVHVDAQGE